MVRELPSFGDHPGFRFTTAMIVAEQLAQFVIYSFGLALSDSEFAFRAEEVSDIAVAVTSVYSDGTFR